MIKKFSELKQSATQIKSETQAGANTASRIGGCLENIVDTVGGVMPIEAELIHECPGDGTYTTLIRCRRGDIVETDTLCLARYINRRRKRGDRTRYKGWIIPGSGQIDSSSLLITMEYDYSDDNYDYWEVTIDGGSIPMYEQGRLDGVDIDIESTYLPISLQSKCAFFISRGGKRISEYMKFTVRRSGDDYFVGLWA